MFSTFFSFEIKAWLRSPMPWIFLFVFTLMTFGATVSDDVQIGGSYGNVWKNAPFVAQNWYVVFSILSLLLVVAFLNGAAIRDFENNTSQIVFSSPISKAGYYFGHFAGALVIALIPMIGVSLGMWLGAVIGPAMGWVDAARFGPFEVQGHLNAYVTVVIPNMIFAGGILYAVATLTRSTMYSFVAAVILLVGYIIAGNLMRDMQNEQVASLLDPFGSRPFSILTKYWTVDEKNHQSVGLFAPGILANRLLWMSVGLAVLIAGYFKFDFAEKVNGRKKAKTTTEPEEYGLKQLGALPRVIPGTGTSTTLSQLWSQLRTDFKGVIKSTPFILLTFIGLLNCIPSFQYATDGYGTHNLPVTYTMVEIVRGAFYLFTISILTYFTGALVWKERNAKVNEIYDALPTRTWTGYVSKYFTIVSVVFLLNLVAIIAAVGAQVLHGYDRFEFGVYIRELLVLDVLGFAFLAAVFMFVHALSPNMYLGFFICIVLVAVNSFVWGVMDISSNMVKLGGTPSYIVSDLYGYQPYARGLAWFHSYWLLFGGLLAVAGICLWPRGKESGWRKRLSLARQEWKTYKMAGLGLLLLWICTAGFVFYNTKTLNKPVGENTQEKRMARYENEYKRFQGFPQPRTYGLKYDIRISPETRSYEADGQMWVRNLHAKPIDSLFVHIPDKGDFLFENPRLSLLLNDSALYLRFYKISPALAPGDSMLLKFNTIYHAKGFENELSNTSIMQNGTFFNNGDISPTFGYHEGGELSEKNKRRDYGLPEKTRMAPLDTANYAARSNQYLNIDSDWVTVETTISTSADQLAIAPGSLLSEKTEGNRRIFHYKLDHKAWNFYSFLSARYEVAREEKRGITYEVYYHADHARNVPRMLKAMQKSIEYYTTNFGPYYHKQCRIIEFPRYAEFAQAFPGTMPYSEGIGFIEDFRQEEDDIDMVFYVVSHEMGHQWWAHQECGANMQGAEMTTETFAQYSALMVMEHEYGRDMMRKFLEYETDQYLRGRGRETQSEMPIAKCERQGYIHYNKGSAVMYYLKEMIGEDKVNAGLKTFLEKFRYKNPPYPTSIDVVNEFAAQTPDSLKYIIQDLFWDITLFENKTKETSMKDLGNGKYEVTIQVECHKLKADELGKETEVPVNDWMEIGAFAKPEGDKKYGKTLYRQRVKIAQKDNTFTFLVDEKPDKAGIDPFRILIDREPKDNVKELK
ncbi:MAG: M1 family aminopeptidase [Saprospiraceae bacterium]